MASETNTSLSDSGLAELKDFTLKLVQRIDPLAELDMRLQAPLEETEGHPG